ncbi:hypothetical protein ACFSTA_01345 [Ornithinibacillus salinisoli]|uniref:Lipoprotein n=1 Tax=Ornithinibacillus salinisoli TaxID=1848459 RepID=A0ABW4VTA6_9BACI
MRKYLTVFVFIVIIASGCSHSTLKEAINSSGLSEHDEPEILFQNDDDGIVIFLTKDAEGSYIVCRSEYSLKNERYKVETSDPFTKKVDIVNRNEFLTVDLIEDGSDNPIRIVWGGVFHYPQAEKVEYMIKDKEGNSLHQNSTDINSKHIFLDKLPDHIEDTDDITFQVLDNEGNVLFDQS